MLIKILPDDLPKISLITSAITASMITMTFWVKQMINDPNRKAREDKALLKQLLEGFGLEIPQELKELDEPVIHSTNPQ